MYFNNKAKFEDSRREKLAVSLKTAKDSLSVVQQNFNEANYFSLENNTNAKEYFLNKDIDALLIKIRDDIYKQNINPNGNPLARYSPMDGRPFTINKIKVLNNRWIIADFSNGVVWGEAFIKYFVNENGSIDYEVAETLLHANTVR